MEGGVDQSDDNRVSVHHLKDALEVPTLYRQQLIQVYLSLFLDLGQDHLLYDGQTLFLEEHVLCTAQTNTFGSELAGDASVFGVVGIGPDA